jgi:hypothetical protein
MLSFKRGYLLSLLLVSGLAVAWSDASGEITQQESKNKENDVKMMQEEDGYWSRFVQEVDLSVTPSPTPRPTPRPTEPGTCNVDVSRLQCSAIGTDLVRAFLLLVSPY